MTVFKAFLKVLNKCKGTIILYTVILVAFGAMNMSTNDNSTNFVESKPNVLVVNEDEEKGVTKGLIQYLSKHTDSVHVEDNEEARNDALFYRDANYIIYIPKGFRTQLLAGEDPQLKVKSTGDYQSYYAELLLERYVKAAKNYRALFMDEDGQVDEEALTKEIKATLAKETDIQVTSKLDTDKLSRASFYFNFMNYGLLAGAIFTICMVLSSFQEEKLRRRTMISSMPSGKHNRILLLANGLFALILWAAYAGIGFLLCGTDVLVSKQGIVYLVNSLIFTFCAVTIAFLLANLIQSKNALNGIINVLALGSSFLCGAFVPIQWLPDSVLTIAHILPSYWYIQTNEALKTLENWTMDNIRPLLFNMGMVLAFSIVFIIIANVLSTRKKENR